MRYRVAAINYLISTFRGSHLVVDTEIWAVVGSFIAQEACFTRSESETRRRLVETGGWVQCPPTLACPSAGRAENEKDACKYSDSDVHRRSALSVDCPARFYSRVVAWTRVMPRMSLAPVGGSATTHNIAPATFFNP